MIGYYNYTVILTYIGALVGLSGIGVAFGGDIKTALILLMIAGFCDLFDGKIASTKKDRTREEKLFGVQIDSLSDLLCFGALPALIAYVALPKKIIIMVLCALYFLAALIRLAFFNVDEMIRQEHSDEGRVVYYGMPVTASALLFPMAFAFSAALSLPVNIVVPVVMMASAVAYLWHFSINKPNMLGKVLFIIIGIAALTCLLMKGC